MWNSRIFATFLFVHVVWIVTESQSGNCLINLSFSVQGHLQEAAQGLTQLSFEYLQGHVLHSLPGKLIPVLNQIMEKNISLTMKWIFLYFNLCLLTLVLSLATTEKSVSIDFFTFAYQKFMHMDKIPLSSLYSKLENTNSLCLSLLLSLSPCSI